MSIQKRGCCSLKTYGNYIYSWCPDKTKNKPTGIGVGVNKNYCTAIPYSQGEDWVTTYSYNLTTINGKVERLAYVACDYVK